MTFGLLVATAAKQTKFNGNLVIYISSCKFYTENILVVNIVRVQL